MIDYMLNCFNLLFNLLSSGSWLVWLPFCVLVFCWVFLLVLRMIRGKYNG